MSYETRLRRNRIIGILVLSLIFFGCARFPGMEFFLQMLSFLAVVIGLIGGTLFIFWRFGKNETIAFFALAAWYGVMFATFAFLGMAFDADARNLSWSYRFQIAGLIAVGVFLFAIIIAPIYAAIFSASRRLFDKTISHREKDQ